MAKKKERIPASDAYAASIAAVNIPAKPHPNIPRNDQFQHAVIIIKAANEENAHKAAIKTAEEVWLPFKGWQSHTAVVQRISKRRKR